MTPTDRDKLLALIRLAGDAPPAGPHVADDADLLTAWRLNELTSAEGERFFGHLASCTACRAAVVDLSDVFTVSSPAAPHRTSRRRRLWWTAGVAAAACLVIGVTWALSTSSDSDQFARARQEARDGQLDRALKRLSGIRPDRLRTDEERAEFARVYEAAVFRAALADLMAGDNEDAAAHVIAARARGVDSPRLTDLYLLATSDRPGVEAALERFTSDHSTTPQGADGLVVTALCLERLGRPGEARPYWEKALPSVTDTAVREQIAKHLNE